MERKFKELEKPFSQIVNKSSPKFSLPIIKSNLELYSTIKKQIEKELYKNFLNNCDKIIHLLTSFNKVAKISAEYNNLLKKFNKSLNQFHNKYEYVDAKKRTDFQILMSKFENMEYFVSQGRYLIHFALFNNYILILTNDLLFIGEAVRGDKYKLFKVFNYNIIKVKAIDDVLEISTEKDSFRFQKDVESVLKVVSIVNEFNYKPVETNEEVEDKLEEIPLIHCREDFMNYKNSNPLIIGYFLVNRFEYNLKRINKICLTEEFLHNVFEFFWKYYDEQEELISDMCSVKAFILEGEMKCLFKFIEKRVFYVFDPHKTTVYIDIIKKGMNRNGIDLSYFMTSLGFSNREFDLGIENAKERVADILNEMKISFNK